MELRRVTIVLSFAGLAGLGTAAATEGPQDKDVAQPPKAIFRGVGQTVKFDISPPLRSMAPVTIQVPGGDRGDDQLWGTEKPFGPRDVDTSCQTKVGSGEIPSPGASFDGFSNACGCSPPDTDGDVGPNHYVAMVNLHFAIYSKTGALMFGPTANNTLWSGFGGPCQTTNAGDPVVLHDQMADRWIFTQFTNPGPPFFNCFAISTTPDPMGPYFRYQVGVPTNVLPDYPKWGVWPDAYYLSTREVSAGTIGAYALDRAAVIAGVPTTAIGFGLPIGGTPNGGDGILPSDMDGNTLPPAGSPNYYVGSMDNGGPYGAPQDALTFYKFHVDFVTPANSTFTGPTIIPVAAFNSVMPAPCPSNRQCIPQPTTANRIDHLGYRQRPTFRLAYRNFGTHESLVTNQSVDAGVGMAGIRWWEIRSPNTAPVIFQQGTYAPGLTDGIHRWMGSIAMDRAGNMALGYSASDGTAVFPSVRYTGRLVTDAPGTMPQGEGIIHTGTGSQTGSARWGDYSAMTVDPTDDCTFWYINEYLPVNSANGWRLRIGQFKYPSPQCIPVPVDLQGFSIE